MQRTKIDWCDSTLNPVVGCTFGCPFCYARRMNTRFKWIEDFSKPQFFPERLKALYSKKPQTIFMDSMSDIADWHSDWIERTFITMRDNPQHKYLFLTKRMVDYGEKDVTNYDLLFETNASKNVLFGSSITKQSGFDGLDEYGQISDFLSVEPILEPINLNKYRMLKYVKWVIVGAETGNRKEKVIPKHKWLQDIVCQCKILHIPIFMKSSLKDIWGEPLIQEFPW
jgi:protein gp37